MVKKKAQFAPPPFIAPFGVPGAGPPGRGIPQPGQAQLHGMPPGAMPPGMMPGMHPGMMMPWVWQVPGAWFGFGVQGGHQPPNMGPGLQPGHGLQLPMPGGMPGHQDSRSGQINLPSISAEVGNQRHEYVVVDTTRKENNRNVKVQVAINKQIYEAITNQFGNLQANIQKSPVLMYFRDQGSKPPKQVVVLRLGSEINSQEFKIIADALWHKLNSAYETIEQQAKKFSDEGNANLAGALRTAGDLSWYIFQILNSSNKNMKDGLYTISNVDSMLRTMKSLLSSNQIDQNTKNSIQDIINILSLLHSDGNNISGYQALLMAYRIAGNEAFSSEILSSLVSGDNQQAARILLSSAYRNKTDEEINDALSRLDVNKFVEEYGEKLQQRQETKANESEIVRQHREYHQNLQKLQKDNVQAAQKLLSVIGSNRQLAEAIDPDQAFYITNAWFSQFSGIGSNLGSILADESKRQQALGIINRAISNNKMAYNLSEDVSDHIYNSSGFAADQKAILRGMTFIDGTSGMMYDPVRALPLDKIHIRNYIGSYNSLEEIYRKQWEDRRAVAAAALHYTIRYNPGISFIAKSFEGYTIIAPIHITVRPNVTPEEYIKSVARAYISYECNNGVSGVCDLLKGNNLDVALRHSVTLQRIVSSLIQNDAAKSLKYNADLLKTLKAEVDRAFRISAIDTSSVNETDLEAHLSETLREQ